METDLEGLLKGNHELAKKLCMLISTDRRTTLLSSISIHSVLTLLSQDPYSFFNKGILRRLLNIDINTASACYKNIFALLNSIDSRNFLFANKAYIKEQCELEELFRTRFNSDFLYELDYLNFDENDTAAELMNNWIEEKTYNKTSGLINSSNIKDKTHLALLNTTCFNDKWAKPFTETVPGTFHINGTDTLPVEMMKIKSEFYYKNSGFNSSQVLQLPFINKDLSLIIVLPTNRAQSGNFDTLHYYDIDNITEGMILEEVDVLLPKFKINEILELNKYINEIGLENILSSNFNGMINDEYIHLNKLQQKTFIDVNQEGAEAVSGLICSLDKVETEKAFAKNGLIVYEMNIKTNISNRFAKTKIIWKVKNVEKSTREATFKVVLSETAFITGFVMEIEGKSYKSYIKEKEEAKAIYNEAVARGQSAGLVEAKTRDSKEFSVSINLEAESVAVFNLTYEEMLQRIHDQYELIVNICPGQIVDNLNIEVDIMETRPLKFVKTPPLRSGNEIGNVDEKCLDPLSKIQMVNAKTASIKFNPHRNRQRLMAHHMQTDPSDGLSGQFVVQYDVERDPQDGQVLLQDGYFVHFFAPNDLDPLPKHVVFVLDTSGSMGGRKIIQLKDAMMSILQEIRKDDMINIVEFNSDVIIWNINTEQSSTVPAFTDVEDFQDPFNKLSKMYLPEATCANEETLMKARNVVQKINAFGGTYMIGGLDVALYLTKLAQDKTEKKSEKHQSIIVFLTDGEPNVGISSTDQIIDTVSRLNSKHNQVPIFSLSFGRGADKSFLRKLSLRNQGFSRHIYEAADASLQLQEFYKQISSPLLADIQFKYDSEVEDVTKTYFPIFFGGSELVVAGRYTEPSFPTTINCRGPRGPIIITSVIDNPVTSLERLWAYLTVKQLLDARETVDDKTDLTKKATSLALRYSFVTDVTSLVVVKPNDTSSTLDDSASKSDQGIQASHGPRLKFAMKKSSNTSSISFDAPTAQHRSHASSAGFCGPAVSANYMSTFGSPNLPVFGGPASGQMSFGSSNLPVFGGSTSGQMSFGSSNLPVFGGSASGQKMSFGSARTPQSTPFCATMSQPSSGFSFQNQQESSGQPTSGQQRSPSSAPDSSRLLLTNQPLGDAFSLEKKKPIEFIADHPFLIILQCKRENKKVILFNGCIYNPTY